MDNSPPCSICTHLLAEPAQDFEVHYTSQSNRPSLFCMTHCASNEHDAPARDALREVPHSAWQAVLARGEWEETSGKPPRPVHVTSKREEFTSFPLPDTSPEHVLAITFVSDTLFVLVEERGTRILRSFVISTSSAPEERPSCRIDTLIEDAAFWSYGADAEAISPVMLCVSACKRYVCVAQLFGSFASLIELSSPRHVRVLDRGDYHENVSEFPAAFASVDGEVVLIAGSDWNRVDVYRARDGELLTARDFPQIEDEQGKQKQAHALDYFYGSLLVSPGSKWVMSSGWCWHPVGVVTYWNLRHWMEENVFESEDGASRRGPGDLVDDLWDRTLVFLDEDRLLVWGIFHDSFLHTQGLMIYDLEQGALLDLIPLEGMQCHGLVCLDDTAWIRDEHGEIWQVNLSTHRLTRGDRELFTTHLLSPHVALCHDEEGGQLDVVLLGPLT